MASAPPDVMANQEPAEVVEEASGRFDYIFKEFTCDFSEESHSEYVKMNQLRRPIRHSLYVSLFFFWLNFKFTKSCSVCENVLLAFFMLQFI